MPGHAYVITDVGTSGGALRSGAYGINNSGSIVGWADYGNGHQHAFLWTPGQANGGPSSIKDLGSFVGVNASNVRSEARAINDAGQVVGWAQLATGERRAFLWPDANGKMVDLGTLGGRESIAYGINSSGSVVGLSDLGNGHHHAFLWMPDQADGKMADLGGLGHISHLKNVNSEALCINDDGLVAGRSDFPMWVRGPLAYHAVLWPDGPHTIQHIGPQQPTWSGVAMAMNSTGQIVGHFFDNLSRTADGYAFLWTPGGQAGEIRNLGADKVATFINNVGQVVGYTSSNGHTRAIIWEDGIAQDLNTLLIDPEDWTLNEAYGINDAGQIVGQGTKDGKPCAFLLTPITVYSINGQVINEVGDPISLATIADDHGRSVSSKADGTYELQLLPQGDFDITPRKVGYTFVPPSHSVVDLSSDVDVDFMGITRYTITDLGTLGGTRSYAFAINNSGQIVGVADTDNGLSHAFLWPDRAGKMRDLDPKGYQSEAYAINDNGQVVGWARSASSGGHAFLWPDANGKMVDLGALGGDMSWANAINNKGQVVGGIRLLNGKKRAFFWADANSGMVDLNAAVNEDEGDAFDINDAGQVVGWVKTEGADSRAFLWENSGDQKQNLSALVDGFPTEARAINSKGQVVGTVGTGEGVRPYLWTPDAPNGAIIKAEHLGASSTGYANPLAVNSRGKVVGVAGTGSRDKYAFIWTDRMGMRDLNTLVINRAGWTLETANDINDAGQIIGQGIINGVAHAFLLKPVHP